MRFEHVRKAAIAATIVLCSLAVSAPVMADVVGTAAMVAVAMLVPGGLYWVGGLSMVLFVSFHFIKRSAWV